MKTFFAWIFILFVIYGLSTLNAHAEHVLVIDTTPVVSEGEVIECQVDMLSMDSGSSYTYEWSEDGQTWNNVHTGPQQKIRKRYNTPAWLARTVRFRVIVDGEVGPATAEINLGNCLDPDPMKIIWNRANLDAVFVLAACNHSATFPYCPGFLDPAGFLKAIDTSSWAVSGVSNSIRIQSQRTDTGASAFRYGVPGWPGVLHFNFNSFFGGSGYNITTCHRVGATRVDGTVIYSNWLCFNPYDCYDTE